MQILKEPFSIPGDVIEEREFPSDAALVTPNVARVVQVLMDRKLIDPSFKNKIELCLDEAITNSIVHGNNNDFAKMVKVSVWTNDESWGVAICDEGEGFSIDEVSRRQAESDDLWKENGRGLALLTLYMDEVLYYENGSKLVLSKRLEA